MRGGWHGCVRGVWVPVLLLKLYVILSACMVSGVGLDSWRTDGADEPARVDVCPSLEQGHGVTRLRVVRGVVGFEHARVKSDFPYSPNASHVVSWAKFENALPPPLPL